MNVMPIICLLVAGISLILCGLCLLEVVQMARRVRAALDIARDIEESFWTCTKCGRRTPIGRDPNTGLVVADPCGCK